MRAKKSLGQNFLNSKTVAKEIARAAQLSPEETVLEIGPGKGFLTAELLASGAHVIAVEKDDRLIPLLEEKFSREIADKKFTLIHGDILEKLKEGSVKLPNTYKLIANIPYYITGQIIRTFLEIKNKPSQMVLMVQKEVAMRIVASDKKESILSIAVKAYGTPKLVKKVPARYFTPAPKVDSAVLSIENISGENFNNISEKHFFDILHAGFAHKRKVLTGNLKELLGSSIVETVKQLGLKENVRAEDLHLEHWLTLSKN